MIGPPMNDKEIRDSLEEIDDDDDITITSWEANFIESIVFKYTGPLSEKQRKTALQIIEKYL